jgi:hypothetical protein
VVGGTVSMLVSIAAWIILVRRGDIASPRPRFRKQRQHEPSPASPAELQPSDR